MIFLTKRYSKLRQKLMKNINYQGIITNEINIVEEFFKFGINIIKL